jgi:hypothetical protein
MIDVLQITDLCWMSYRYGEVNASGPTVTLSIRQVYAGVWRDLSWTYR